MNTILARPVPDNVEEVLVEATLLVSALNDENAMEEEEVQIEVVER